MPWNRLAQAYQKLKHAGAGILILTLLCSCETTVNVPQRTATSSFALSPTIRVTTTAPSIVLHTPLPTVVTPLPADNQSVSAALFIVLTEDGSKLLAAYDGESQLQTLYDIPQEMGRAQIRFHPAQFAPVSNRGLWATVIENKEKGTSDIYLVDIMAHKAASILSWVGPQFEAAVSPDGKWVAFLSSEGECSEVTGYDQRYWCPRQHLYIMSIDGSNIKRLTTTPANRCFLTWSPTSKQLAFQEGCDPTSSSRLYLVSPLNAGTDTIVQVDSDGGAPSWSPDGRWLHWLSGNNIQKLAWLDADGNVTSRFDLGAIIQETNVTWSPDSKQMAEIVGEGNREGIQLWDLGSNVRRHELVPTQGIKPRLQFKWLSDGKRFILCGYKLDNNYQISNKLSWFVVNLDGTQISEFN